MFSLKVVQSRPNLRQSRMSVRTAALVFVFFPFVFASIDLNGNEISKTFVRVFDPRDPSNEQQAKIFSTLRNDMTSYSNLNFRVINCSVKQVECRFINDTTTSSYLLLDGADKLVEIYTGLQELNSLRNYCILMSRGRTKRSATETTTDEVVIKAPHLTAATFDDYIKTNYTFVLFYVSWCSHCKKYKPYWNEMYERYKNNMTVTIAVVDCVAEKKSGLCYREGVNGYPTMLLYKDGKCLSEYDEGRNINQLEAYLARSQDEKLMEAWVVNERRKKERSEARKKARKAAKLAADAKLAEEEKLRQARNACVETDEQHEMCIPEWAQH